MAIQEITNWHEEKQSAYLYRVLARIEASPVNARLFQDLAEAAEEQALIWEKKIINTGAVPPHFSVSIRARIVTALISLLGPRAIRPVLAAMKVRGLSVYSHEKMLRIGHPMPTSVDDIGHRHATVGGGNFRAAVFGVSDGLVSNAALVLGFSGAVTDNSMILLAGVAGLVAGAASMAAGEYVSVRSQRELYEYQIQLEREELEEYPEEETEELALIYAARGLEMDQARALASEIMQDPEHALETLSREELGLNPADLGSPWGAAIASFTSFSLGAVIPLLPFLYGSDADPVRVAMFMSACGLFLVGAMTSLFSGRSAWYGGLRMVLIGGGAGILAFAVGSLMGAGLM